jgi:hypothetical protein
MIKSTLMASALSLSFMAASVSAGEPKHVASAESPVALFKDIYGAYPASEAADAWHKADKAWLGKGSVDTLPSWDTLPLSAGTNDLNRRVNKILAKSGEVCIDYDQISDSQDPNIAKYKIVGPAEPPAERAEYQVEMQGTWRKGVTKVTYLLVKEQGKWRVDDIVTYSTDAKGKPEKNSGREMLKACLKT